MSGLRWIRAESVVVLCVAASFLLVWPVGNYVIGDDWAYTKSLQHLHRTGEVRILDWNPMTLVAHLYWGLLFTKIFGFGMTVSRISTVILVLVECWALIALLRHLGVGLRMTTLAVLGLLFGPLHFFQAFMYSTDIPANAWSGLALLFYLLGLSRREPGSNRLLLMGSAFAGVAWSVRQSAILVVAGLLVYLVSFERERLKRVGTWFSCFALPALAVVAVYGWYYGVHGPTAAHANSTDAILAQLGRLDLGTALHNGYVLLIYLAFFLLPVLVATPPGHYRPRGRSRIIAACIAGAALIGGSIWISALGESFPYLRNKITAFGYLHPNELIVGARDVLWPAGTGWVIGGLLCLTAVGAALLLIRRARDDPSDDDTGHARQIGVRLLGLVLALQFVYAFLTYGILFDRHLVMAAPIAIALFATIAGTAKTLRLIPGTLVVLALATYSVAGTHDVHSFSRAAFRAGEQLMREGTDPQLIEGGYAFNGWHMYERSREELQAGRKPLVRVGDAWYLSLVTPRILSKYVIALSGSMNRAGWSHAVAPWAEYFVFQAELKRYRPVWESSYRNYWPPGRKKIYVLEDVSVREPKRMIDSR